MKSLEAIFTKTFEYLKVGYKIMENRYISARMIEKIVPFKSSGVWVDVGFGNGSLLFTAEEYGYKPIGVDLRRENVSILLGLDIGRHCNLVQNIEFEKPIAVASMMDVLEHVPYPKEVLTSVHSKIEKNGCLLISMPNSESWVWKFLTMNKVNPYFNSIEHCHNFSRTRLEALLNECGFAIKCYGISERYRYCMEIVAQRIED